MRDGVGPALGWSGGLVHDACIVPDSPPLDIRPRKVLRLAYITPGGAELGSNQRLDDDTCLVDAARGAAVATPPTSPGANGLREGAAESFRGLHRRGSRRLAALYRGRQRRVTLADEGEGVDVGAFREHVTQQMARTMTRSPVTQIDLFAWAQERDRVAGANAERASRRGYLVFATKPGVSPEEPDYREVYATEAKTPNQAISKVRPLAEGRRFRAYLATGTYRDELADARWVA